MMNEIEKFVDNFLGAAAHASSCLSFVDIRHLEDGRFTTGDIAVVSGIPKKKRKLDDGREIEEEDVATLRGGLSVMNGDDVIFYAPKGCWFKLDNEYVEPEYGKKLSEIYREINFIAEVEYA